MSLENKRIENLLQKIKDFPRPLLLGFDVDGTLAPIVSRPEQAKIPEEVIKALEKLNTQQDFAIAFLSGRDEMSLSSMMNMKPFWVASQHGRFIKKSNDFFPEYVEDNEAKRRLDDLIEKLQKRFEKLPLLLEKKRGAVAVHTRKLHALDPRKSTWVLKEIKIEAEQMGLTARDGKMVCEVESYGRKEKLSDKGQALREIAERTSAQSVFFVGDDITDIPAIEFAKSQTNGLGCLVSSNEMSPQIAKKKFALQVETVFHSVEEVHQFIQQLQQTFNSPK